MSQSQSSNSSSFRPSRTFGSLRSSPFKRHQSSASLSQASSTDTSPASSILTPPPLRPSGSSASLRPEATPAATGPAANRASWGSAPSTASRSTPSLVHSPSKLNQSLNATVADAVDSDDDVGQPVITESNISSNTTSSEKEATPTPQRNTSPSPAEISTPEVKSPEAKPLSAVQSRVAEAESKQSKELPPTPLHQTPPRPVSQRGTFNADVAPLNTKASFTNQSPARSPSSSPTKTLPLRPLPKMPAEAASPQRNYTPPTTTTTATTTLPAPFQNDAVSRLPAAQVRELREAFQVLDRDNDGTVTREDVAEMLASLGLDTTNPATMDAYFPAGDSAAAVNLPGYLNSIASLLEPFSSREELVNAFAAFDEDDSGQVDLEELKAAVLDPTLGGGEVGGRLGAKDVENVVAGFTGRRVFDVKGIKGSGAQGQWSGGRRPEVLRYQEFVNNIAGPVGGAQD